MGTSPFCFSTEDSEMKENDLLSIPGSPRWLKLSLDFDDFDNYIPPPPDGISKLPDSVLSYILSSLQMQYIVRTSCLSTRWKDLWKSVPNMDFTEVKFRTTEELVKAVGKALEYHEGSQVKKFRVCAACDLCPPEHVDSWIAFVVRHNVEELYLDCTPFNDSGEDEIEGYGAPKCIYTCGSLENLAMKHCEIKLPSCIRLGSLKTLHLEHVELADGVLKDLLRNCPVLKDLTLNHCNRWRDLSIVAMNSGLESLNVHEDYDDSAETIEIVAPYLLSLNFCGEPKRAIYRGKSLTSLVSASFNFNSSVCPVWEFEEHIPFGQFLDDFCHVKVLKLSSWCTMNLSVKAILDLGGLVSYTITKLSLQARFKKCELPGIAYLLRAFVNLEVLIIDVVEADKYEFDYFLETNDIDETVYWRPDDLSFPGLLQHLKTVEIRGFLGSIRIPQFTDFRPLEETLHARETEFEFVRFLLKNLTALETMTISPTEYLYKLPKKFEVLFKVASRLLGFFKSSPNAQIYIRDN